MSNNEEKKKIIKMVANNKITAEEGEKLLSTLDSKKENTEPKNKKLIFRITKENQTKPKVNIAIPLSLAKFGIKLIPKQAKINANINNTNFDFSSIDWKEIIEMATEGVDGDLFYMDVTEDDGSITNIRIFVE